jgi:hypothetical protein
VTAFVVATVVMIMPVVVLFFLISLPCRLHWLRSRVVMAAHCCTGRTAYRATHDGTIAPAHIAADGRARATTYRTAQNRPRINRIGVNTGRQQHENC